LKVFLIWNDKLFPCRAYRVSYFTVHNNLVKLEMAVKIVNHLVPGSGHNKIIHTRALPDF
jgi:hypothetical protein